MAEVLEAVEQLIKREAHTRYLKVSPEDIEFISNREVRLVDELYEVSKEGLIGLMKVLKMPTNFSKYYEENLGFNEWETLNRKLIKILELKKELITVKVIGNTVVAFSKASTSYITDTTFLDFIEEFKDTHKDLELAKVSYTNTLSSFYFLDNTKVLTAFGKDSDQWKKGLVFTNRTDLQQRPDVSTYLERLACTNGQTMRADEMHVSIKNLETNSEGMVRAFKKHTEYLLEHNFNEYFDYKTKQMKNTQCSVDEILTMSNTLTHIAKDNGLEYLENLVTKTFDCVDYVKNRYRVEDILVQSKRWKTLAESGMNYYDAYNKFTEFVSHTPDLNEQQRVSGFIKAGRLFTKNLDLIDMPTLR